MNESNEHNCNMTIILQRRTEDLQNNDNPLFYILNTDSSMHFNALQH